MIQYFVCQNPEGAIVLGEVDSAIGATIERKYFWSLTKCPHTPVHTEY